MIVQYIVLMLATTGISCQGNKGEASLSSAKPKDETLVSLTEAQLQNAQIETVTLSDQPIASILKLNGKIDVPPQNLVSVSIPLGGYLKSTSLLPGMKVSKGDIIAVVENPQFIQLQQDYLAAQSKLQFAQLDYRRQKELNQSQASSDKVMQQAQAEMNSQQITMNAIARQLELIHIQPSTVTQEISVKARPSIARSMAM